MSLAWGGKYAFESGDVVEVKAEHPLGGRVGVVKEVHGDRQFKVYFPDKEGIVFQPADLRIIKPIPRRLMLDVPKLRWVYQ